MTVIVFPMTRRLRLYPLDGRKDARQADSSGGSVLPRPGDGCPDPADARRRYQRGCVNRTCRREHPFDSHLLRGRRVRGRVKQDLLLRLPDRASRRCGQRSRHVPDDNPAVILRLVSAERHRRRRSGSKIVKQKKAKAIPASVFMDCAPRFQNVWGSRCIFGNGINGDRGP